MLWTRKDLPAPPLSPEPTDPVDVLFDAVARANDAWAAMPRDVSLWIDWKNRRVTVQTRYSHADLHSRDSLRQELERRQAPYSK